MLLLLFSLFLGSLGSLDRVLRVCWCLKEISFCSSSLSFSTILLLMICWIVKSAVSRSFSTLDSLFSMDLMLRLVSVFVCAACEYVFWPFLILLALLIMFFALGIFSLFLV